MFRVRCKYIVHVKSVRSVMVDWSRHRDGSDLRGCRMRSENLISTILAIAVYYYPSRRATQSPVLRLNDNA